MSQIPVSSLPILKLWESRLRMQTQCRFMLGTLWTEWSALCEKKQSSLALKLKRKESKRSLSMKNWSRRTLIPVLGILMGSMKRKKQRLWSSWNQLRKLLMSLSHHLLMKAMVLWQLLRRKFCNWSEKFSVIWKSLRRNLSRKSSSMRKKESKTQFLMEIK